MTREIRHAGEGSKGALTARQEWRTPTLLARAIIARFNVGLDAAATYENAIVERFIGPPGIVERSAPASRQLVGVDALKTSWAGLVPRDMAIFCNPPFSSFAGFVAQALIAAAFRDVILLGPISVDTRWFGQLADAGAEVFAFRGRVRFQPSPALCDCGVTEAGNVDPTPVEAHGRVIYNIHTDELLFRVTANQIPGLLRENEAIRPCAYVDAAKHGPAFPSAMYRLSAGAARRKPGELVPMRVVDPVTLDVL